MKCLEGPNFQRPGGLSWHLLYFEYRICWHLTAEMAKAHERGIKWNHAWMRCLRLLASSRISPEVSSEVIDSSGLHCAFEKDLEHLKEVFFFFWLRHRSVRCSIARGRACLNQCLFTHMCFRILLYEEASPSIPPSISAAFLAPMRPLRGMDRRTEIPPCVLQDIMHHLVPMTGWGRL